MKKFYEAPTSELIVVSTADIITLSFSKIDIHEDEFEPNDGIGEIEI